MRLILLFIFLTSLQNTKLSADENKDSLLLSLEEKIVSAPSEWETLEGYKNLCDSLKELERGIDFLKELIDEKNKIPELHTILGLFYIEKLDYVGDIEKGFLAGNAMDEFNLALKIDSLFWGALYARGMVYLNLPPSLADYELALKDFQKLLHIQEKSEELKSHFSLTYIALGDLYIKIKKQDEALTIWKKGLNLFPENKELKDRTNN